MNIIANYKAKLNIRQIKLPFNSRENQAKRSQGGICFLEEWDASLCLSFTDQRIQEALHEVHTMR